MWLRSPVALYFALLLAGSLIFSGCTEPSPGSEGVEDALGRRVVLDGTPQRIVSLAPSVTEMIFEAGAGERVVGVSTADDYPPAVDTLVRVSTHPLHVEGVLALEPDLILASSQVNAARDAEIFTELGIPVYFLKASTLDGIVDDLRLLGSLLGIEERANRAADRITTQLDALREATDTLSSRPRTLFLIGIETLYSFGSESYIHDLIAAAGGESITADLEVRNPVLSTEYVLDAEPEVIIGAFGDDTDPAQLVRHHPSWQAVPAARAGRLYSVDPDIVLRPGPRLVEGAWKMAELLHGISADTTAAAH